MRRIRRSVFLFCSVNLLNASNPSCKWDTSGINIYVDNNLLVSMRNETQVPSLPDGTPSISYGHIHGCKSIVGTITVGGTLSLGKEDAYYSQSVQLRRSVQIFLDWLNNERGGVLVNGSRYAMRFRWVDDSSKKQQVSLAMANALRAEDGSGKAQFAFAGYSSGLTEFASQQSHADGLLMLAATAASPQAFVHNNMTFGTESAAPTWMEAAVKGIIAAHVNFTKSATPPSSGRRLFTKKIKAMPRGTEPLKFGFVQADALFTKSTCQLMPKFVQASASASGTLGGISEHGIKTIPKTPTLDEAMDALRPLQQEGVNVLIGCTYYTTGLMLIQALERLDFAPYAMAMTATVALPGYTDLITRGWWQGEYFLGISPWHASNPGRGALSGMTSQEFSDRYKQRYNDVPSYQGASQFASCCALTAAIEAADSLDTQKVAKAMQQLRLSEFFGEIGFDANGQNDQMGSLVLQFHPGQTRENLVYPQAAALEASLAYPMPTWAQRRCRVIGPGRTWQDSEKVSKDRLPSECSGAGLCNLEGMCNCNEGWSGDDCSRKVTVEETGLPTWATILIAVGVAILGGGAAIYVCFYKNRHIRAQSKVIDGIQKELQELKDSVVGMRSVTSDYMPGAGTQVSIAIDAGPKERAVWYWQEDPGRMASHNASLTLAPHWVMYAGSVAAELEEQYNKHLAGMAPASFQTDLTDRISSTGTEAKAHGQGTGSKYAIDFTEMKQINAQSGYKRGIFRQMVPIGPLSAPSLPAVSSRSSTASERPDQLAGEVLLAMRAGSIVQISKQRPDGWAYGSVVYKPDGGEEFSDSQDISFDAGWFPLDVTEMPTKEALGQLKSMMGSAGADCLTPPSAWQDLKDPLVAQLFPVGDGPEKQAAVDWFMTTLASNVKVVKVERIQNLSLWQSFAVKRQTVLSREGDTSIGSTSKLERKWLFHGTTAEIVPKIVQQGFNRSFCGRNATMYGKGVYFARDASYSSSKAYSAPDPTGVQRMFLCRVVAGAFCQGVKDAVCPNVRDAGKHLLFDTTVDNVNDPSIFVTYHDAQAYPEYLVHFQQ